MTSLRGGVLGVLSGVFLGAMARFLRVKAVRATILVLGLPGRYLPQLLQQVSLRWPVAVARCPRWMQQAPQPLLLPRCGG